MSLCYMGLAFLWMALYVRSWRHVIAVQARAAPPFATACATVSALSTSLSLSLLLSPVHAACRRRRWRSHASVPLAPPSHCRRLSHFTTAELHHRGHLLRDAGDGRVVLRLRQLQQQRLPALLHHRRRRAHRRRAQDARAHAPARRRHGLRGRPPHPRGHLPPRPLPGARSFPGAPSAPMHCDTHTSSPDGNSSPQERPARRRRSHSCARLPLPPSSPFSRSPTSPARASWT